MFRCFSGLAVALLALAPTAASAHLGMTSPESRYGSLVLKDGPCGMTGGGRSANVSTFEPGETIELVWDEYVDHPGHYRVSFDEDGDDDFADPPTMMAFDSNPAVLLDNIPDRDVSPGDSEYRVNVTLPDVECESCTLQIIQVMYDKPPYTTPGNDIYYQCVDLVLRRTTPGTDAGGMGDPDAGTMPGVDAGTTPGTDAGGTVRRDSGPTGTTPMRPETDRGCCTVAPGAERDPLGALAFATLVVAIAAMRRRRRPR